MLTFIVLLNQTYLLDLQLPVQSVPITTNVVSLNPTHCEVYSIQHYVIFVSDLQQVCGFIGVGKWSTQGKTTDLLQVTDKDHIMLY